MGKQNEGYFVYGHQTICHENVPEYEEVIWKLNSFFVCLGVSEKGDEPGGRKELRWDLFLLEMGIQVWKIDLDQTVQNMEILLQLQIEYWLKVKLVN